MTKERQGEVLARLDGKSNLFVIMKRGLYYRPDAKGYTDRIEDAWHVTEDVADRHVYPHDEPVSKRRLDKFPDYLNSYDAIIPLIQKQDNRILREVGHLLLKDCCGNFGEIAVQGLQRTPDQLSEALLRAHNLWEE